MLEKDKTINELLKEIEDLKMKASTPNLEAIKAKETPAARRRSSITVKTRHSNEEKEKITALVPKSNSRRFSSDLKKITFPETSKFSFASLPTTSRKGSFAAKGNAVGNSVDSMLHSYIVEEAPMIAALVREGDLSQKKSEVSRSLNGKVGRYEKSELPATTSLKPLPMINISIPSCKEIVNDNKYKMRAEELHQHRSNNSLLTNSFSSKIDISCKSNDKDVANREIDTYLKLVAEVPTMKCAPHRDYHLHVVTNAVTSLAAVPSKGTSDTTAYITKVNSRKSVPNFTALAPIECVSRNCDNITSPSEIETARSNVKVDKGHSAYSKVLELNVVND